MNATSGSNSTQSDTQRSNSSNYIKLMKGRKTKLEYKVRHGLFRWTIANFSSFPTREDKYLISPVFELEESSWHLALHPKAKSFGINKIALNIIRSRSDPGPRTVSASYRMGLGNGESKIWFRAEENKTFGMGDSYGFETSILGHLQDFMTEGVEDNVDTLLVLCEIYATYFLSVNDENSSNSEMIVDLNLPNDLLKLFKKQRYTNVLIEASNFRIKAHKCVLYARSKTLARMLKDDKSYLRFNCTASCLYCALLYMYSASFDFLAKNAIFSIGLYELACELSLSELRDILSPQIVEMRSGITTDECKLECRIGDFKISDDFPESKAFCDKTTGIRIAFTFRKAENDSNNVECLVGLSGFVEALDFNFNLFLLNENRNPIELIPVEVSRDSFVEFRNFIFFYIITLSADDFMHCLAEDSLSIVFTCKRHSFKHLSDASDENADDPQTLYDSEKWLETMALDFDALRQTSELSDFSLMSMGEIFKVHRCMLAARSGYFRAVISKYGAMFDRNEIRIIHDLNPFTLELMLMYIYAGTLGNTDDLTNEDFLELYEAAEDYEVKSLAEECEEILSIFLDRSFVYAVLIVAKRYKNTHLITLCSNYAQSLDSANSDSTNEPMETDKGVNVPAEENNISNNEKD